MSLTQFYHIYNNQKNNQKGSKKSTTERTDSSYDPGIIRDNSSSTYHYQKSSGWDNLSKDNFLRMVIGEIESNENIRQILEKITSRFEESYNERNKNLTEELIKQAQNLDSIRAKLHDIRITLDSMGLICQYSSNYTDIQRDNSKEIGLDEDVFTLTSKPLLSRINELELRIEDIINGNNIYQAEFIRRIKPLQSDYEYYTNEVNRLKKNGFLLLLSTKRKERLAEAENKLKQIEDDLRIIQKYKKYADQFDSLTNQQKKLLIEYIKLNNQLLNMSKQSCDLVAKQSSFKSLNNSTIGYISDRFVRKVVNELLNESFSSITEEEKQELSTFYSEMVEKIDKQEASETDYDLFGDDYRHAHTNNDNVYDLVIVESVLDKIRDLHKSQIEKQKDEEKTK